MPLIADSTLELLWSVLSVHVYDCDIFVVLSD